MCSRYPIEEDLFTNLKKEIQNEDVDISKNISQIVKNYFWPVEEEIFFFTQPGVMNLTFPCTTTMGAITPGRPCVFPVTWIYWSGYGGNDTFTGCISPYDMGTSKPGCFTKVYENNTVNSNNGTDKAWGYCPDTCKGESPSPSSPYNLAKSKYKSLWKSALYDLNIYTNGYCHTYDPPQKSDPDMMNRIYFMTKRPPLDPTAYFPAHEIFIHQKGQFWPRFDMISFGQPDHVTIRHDELELFFSSKEINTISKTDNPCNMDEDYSFTDCLHKYAIKISNCSIDFFGETQDRNFCTKSGFKTYIQTLEYLKQEEISKIKTETGCIPKCKTIQYSFEKNLQKIDWNRNHGNKSYMSEVYIQPKSSVVDYSNEYYSFDSNDLISSVGGNLGLFLGWSFLTIVEAFGFLLVLVNVGKYLKIK